MTSAAVAARLRECASPSIVACGSVLLACSSAPTMLSVPAELGPAAAFAPEATTWVWTRARGDEGEGEGEGDSPVSYALSEKGEVVAKLPGIRIAAAGTRWSWQEAVEPVATAACDGADQAIERPAGEGRATRVRLVPADPGHDPLALVVPPPADGYNEMDHTARLLASVGPYLFVEESTYLYGCGAHGSSEVRFAVWNVDERSTLDLLRELPDRERLVAAGRSAIDEDARSSGGTDFSGDDDPPTLTELVPRIGPHGRLETSALVSIPSCYACTAGGWSSYTASAPVPVDVPDRLRKLGPVPAAVRLFADRHPDLTIAGYSVEAGDGPAMDRSATARRR